MVAMRERILFCYKKYSDDNGYPALPLESRSHDEYRHRCIPPDPLVLEMRPSPRSRTDCTPAGGEWPAEILQCSILSPLKITASLMGDFDPRKHTAEERGIDAKGNYVRGLKMSDTRFKNMVTGHSPAEQQSMRQQVEEAEEKGLRTYQIKHAKGYYNIENGIVIGSAKGK